MTPLQSKPRRPRSRSVAIAAVVAASVTLLPQASSAAIAATYTVTYGTTGSYSHPTDTPAATFIDKDGTFYFQQGASLYGSTQPRYWDFFTGTNFDTATRSSAISDAVNPNNANDKNNDTTWRCNNSPTGLKSTYAPAGSGYSQRNFCVLVGVWVDPDTGHWYGLVHNEFTPQPFGDGLHYDGIDYAVSTDRGRTWTIKDHVITSPYSTKRGDTAAFPNQTYHYGAGDQRLFVDTASGYFYVYYGSRIVDKGGSWRAFYGHVARSPIASKMAPGSWQKWYNGSWSQPGVGGRESTMVPATAAAPNGYVAPAGEYSPLNTGTSAQQIAAGKMPPTSPLFVMNIAYNAHLGLYIGTPQAVDQSGNAPQEVYATDDLTTQKWTLIGDSGSYKNASWYRWFLDSVNKTGSMIIGKNYRSYCSIACTGSSGQYANTTITSSEPAPALFDPTKTYSIGLGSGRVLAQVSGSSATTSVAAGTGSALENWQFAAIGDGSYKITNASTGQLLGVGSTATTTRAWGTKPTVTAGGPAVGQQWFVIKNPAGTYRLVNRYSGLVLALSSDSTRLAETTPARFWTNTTGDPVGGTRTAAEQALTITVTGSGPASLNGTRTVTTSGKALDNPGSSTTAGTQLITWTPNTGANQRWVFTQQSDGAYTIVNAASNMCVDDYAGGTTPGTKVIQWTCTGGANQRWTATRLSNGSYTLTNVHSGLLLTTASTTNGALVTQESNTGTALQQWVIS
ncbi:RICIN domain-containing protein [Actinokineospora sp. HUAS TT18]|uniref:RICIN domain-containing protein n=1 Tax=Actinokineospora sp. HUAS TT18 TaxID=3447451 RepID=UPI003F526E55